LSEMSAREENHWLRAALRLLYASHNQVRMDTEEDEKLRKDVLQHVAEMFPWLEEGHNGDD